VAAAALSLVVAAVPVGAGSTYSVKAYSNHFTPDGLTVTRGDTVKWRSNEGFHDADITRPSGYLSSNPAPAGSLIVQKQVAAGTFTFLCSLHPGMDGVLRVKPVLARSGSTVTVQLGPVPSEFQHRIQRKRGSSGSWATTTTSAGQDSRSFTLSSGTWYFRVQMFRGSSSSAYSPTRSVSVP
jgi:plastocyanin